VDIDGERAADRLQGTAFPVDPGMHRFRFELAGSPPEEQRVGILEGERNRKLVVQFTRDSTARPAKPNTEPAARPVPGVVVLVGALGIASLGAFGALGSVGMHRENDLRNTCGRGCTEAQVNGLKSQYLVADVFLGVGCASLAATVVLFLTRPTRTKIAQTGGPMDATIRF
jgi:hypothetical protein